MNKNIIAASVIAFGLLGWGYLRWANQIDYFNVADRNVEEKWLPGREQMDAIPFFEQGGFYVNEGIDEDEPVDRDVVVPLIKRLTEEAGMRWVVVYDQSDPKQAYTILAELPKTKHQLQIMDRVIEEEKQKFTGLFLEQRGHRWLSFGFLETEEVDDEVRKAWEGEL